MQESKNNELFNTIKDNFIQIVDAIKLQKDLLEKEKEVRQNIQTLQYEFYKNICKFNNIAFMTEESITMISQSFKYNIEALEFFNRLPTYLAYDCKTRIVFYKKAIFDKTINYILVTDNFEEFKKVLT